jgi:hypothetical protein
MITRFKRYYTAAYGCHIILVDKAIKGTPESLPTSHTAFVWLFHEGNRIVC